MAKLRIIDYRSAQAEKLYQTYLNYRKKNEEKLGILLGQPEPLTKQQYILQYNAKKREQAAEIESGKRGGRTNLAREIADREKYVLSSAEIRGYVRIAKDTGRTDITTKTLQNISDRSELREINAIGTELSKLYRKKKEENPLWNGYDLQKWISDYYFHS